MVETKSQERKKKKRRKNNKNALKHKLISRYIFFLLQKKRQKTQNGYFSDAFNPTIIMINQNILCDIFICCDYSCVDIAKTFDEVRRISTAKSVELIKTMGHPKLMCTHTHTHTQKE